MEQPIYLDNAASTRVADEVVALMTEVMRTAWGNPSAAHPQGAAARDHLATARRRLLAALGDPDGAHGDVVWTSGCTEADALAVLGAARRRDGAVVISTVEHAAIAATAATLDDGRPGAAPRLRTVAPGPDGRLTPAAVAAAARGAAVVALIMVQNEIGVAQPLDELVAAIRAVAPDCHVHVDAAQALGKVPLDVASLGVGGGSRGVDSVALAGHKLHGPKGVGALWLRAGIELAPLWAGGGQQRGLRAGTQDAPGAAGLGLAAERAVAAMPFAVPRWRSLGARVVAALAHAGVACRPLVAEADRAPHILALACPGVPAGALRNVLASRGVYVSTGSACAERDAKPSAALAALGLAADVGMVRLSFGLDTREAEVDRAAAVLCEVLAESRGRS
jgi:cysteine desulfurase